MTCINNNDINVSVLNTITNTIVNLRQDVYNTEDFKANFSNNIYNNLKAKSVTFCPEQFGGWCVNVELEDPVVYAIEFIPQVYQSLVNAIGLSKSYASIRFNNISLSSNIFDIVTTGPNSLSIKI